MPFIGTTPTQGFVSSFPKQSFTPNGSTTVFTLTNPVATANDLEVFVGNVRQEPTTAYTAAGTTLTMSEAPASGLNFYVINKSFAQVTTTPPANSISTDKILNDAVTGAKIENNPTIAGNLTVSGNTAASGTLTSTGLITASAGVAVGGTGSANTLDDYEEGTWTPTLGAGGTNLGIVGTSTYVKVGRQVTVKFDLLSMDSTNGSGFQLESLPFTVGANLSTAGTCMFQNVNLSSSRELITPYVNGSATYIRFYECGDNVSYRQLLGNEFGTSFRAICSITYFVD